MERNRRVWNILEYIRERVEGFALAPFRSEELRLCFIDEADYLSLNAQAALRVLIEKSSDKCRFILALNDITKLATALRSRLHLIDFTVYQGDIPKIEKRLQDWYAGRLAELGITFDRASTEPDRVLLLSRFQEHRQRSSVRVWLLDQQLWRSNWNAILSQALGFLVLGSALIQLLSLPSSRNFHNKYLRALLLMIRKVLFRPVRSNLSPSKFFTLKSARLQW
jgi:hypothetical protein